MMLIEPVVNEVRESAGLSSDASIEWINAIERGLMVDADPDQLFRALLNLVRNAAQAMQGVGQIRLSTRIARQATLARRRFKQAVQVQICDNGPGIPEEIRDKVFYPLVSGREGGSGLGLTLVQNFVTQHQGTVTFDTQAGGTTFTLLLPIQQNVTH